MKRFYRIFLTAVLLVCLGISAGCSRVREDAEAEPGLKVENFDFLGNRRWLTLSRSPQKVIVYGENAVDTLLALQAGDKIMAAVLTDGGGQEEYQRLLPQAKIYRQPLSQEAVLALQPDLLIAPRRFFGEKSLGDVYFWQRNKIAAYIQEASGPIPSLGNFPPCTADSECKFIRNLGRLFQRERQAEQIIASVQKEMQLPLKPAGAKVLVLEFLNGNIEVFGKKLLSGDLITSLGGEIIDYAAPFISMEEVLTAEPDVIFVVYHGGAAEEAAALEQMQQKIFQSMRAVREKRIYPLPYKRIVAPGAGLTETVRLLKQGLLAE